MGAAGTGSLLAHLNHSRNHSRNHRDVPAEEIRFAVVLNGGVSLAVWMGGAVVELDRLIKAGQGGGGPAAYQLMLRLAGASARSDVIAGTSAGGINGAALALAQVNARADVSALRDVWIEQGQIETLLRQPFRGAPTSLMRGDEYFLPQLNAALSAMATPLAWRSPAEAPMDLTMATTVLRGNQLVTTDALGQQLPQELHAAQLRWSRWPIPRVDPRTRAPTPDPFAPGAIRETAARMALAARASASFPFAFEPTFLPVGEDPARSARSLEDQGMRPDLATVVESWGDPARTGDRSRFAVDGGLLANTPTQYALRAIQAMPAARPVRRVLLLVYPHAPQPGLDPPDALTEPPTLRETMTQVLGALSAQGGRTFVEEIEEHNRAAADRRGTRSDILETAASGSPQAVAELADSLFAQYRRLRIWRAARDLAQRRLQTLALVPPERRTAAASWTYERIQGAAESAQMWLDDPSRGADTAQGTGSMSAPRASGIQGGLPYIPATLPTAGKPDAGPGWGWGDSGAARVVEAAADVIRRLVWVLPPGADFDTVADTFKVVSEAGEHIAQARSEIDDPWDTDPVLSTLEPNQSYWAFRLGCYAIRMLGGSWDGLDCLAGQVAQAEAGAVHRATGDLPLAQKRFDEVQGALMAWLTRIRADPGSVGGKIRTLVDAVVAQVVRIVPILVAVTTSAGPGANPGAAAARALVADSGLGAWATFLNVGENSADAMLTRLLQLEVATTALGDETATGMTIPVELVQLSAQTQSPFMRYTRSAADKLGGLQVKHFGGFIKRSWRLNDWIWGRLDAATVLALTVLQPARLRRTAILSGYLSDTSGEDPRNRATATVDHLVGTLFEGSPVTGDPRFVELRARAVDELAAVLDVDRVQLGDLSPAMPGLAALFAWSIHLDVAPTDLPALVQAITGDATDGANARSHGQFFLAENADLVTRVSRIVEQHEAEAVAAADRVAVLAAFDRAGIGREPLEAEVSSDLFLRSATTAAAVAATTLDSARSGLGALRPLTRAVRGGMLVGYWAMTGLTSRAVLAKGLALLGLALGGVFVVLSLFGALPSGISAPAGLVGVSLLLFALAYGALRSGTMLHGLVLLTPIVPLVAAAVDRIRSGTGQDLAGAVHGVGVVGAAVLFAVGLMLLGSLPAALGSPYAALGALATRMGLPPPAAPNASTLGHLVEGTRRRVHGLARLLVREGWRLAAVVAVLALGAWTVGVGWTTMYAALREHLAWCIATGVVLAAAGFVLAGCAGFALQRLQEVRADTGSTWSFPRVDNPAGVQAGWSWVYGVVYLAVAVFLITDPADVSGMLWARSLAALSVVLGVVLTVIVPIVVPGRVLASIRRDECRRAGEVAPFVATAADFGSSSSNAPGALTPDDSYLVDLIYRDRAFRWWVRLDQGEGVPHFMPHLKPRGVRLRQQVDAARAQAGAARGGSAPPTS